MKHTAFSYAAIRITMDHLLLQILMDPFGDWGGIERLYGSY